MKYLRAIIHKTTHAGDLYPSPGPALEALVMIVCIKYNLVFVGQSFIGSRIPTPRGFGIVVVVFLRSKVYMTIYVWPS